MMKPEVQRIKQRRRERQQCPVHSYQRHGKEAEELRKGIEEIIRLGGHDCIKKRDVFAELQRLLDRVDARDSLAYLERCDEDVKRRRGPTQTGGTGR